nr:RteC domain-containing protein [uncultured Pedobacter sp.]
MKELKAHVAKHPFQDEREEIDFFKKVKPKFLCLKIYELCSYNLEQVKPYADKKTLTAYYEEELRFIQRFFQQNAAYYQYYRSGSEELDETYFLRATAKEILTIELIPEQEVGFSTRCDYLFGKFIAYEKISQEIISRINRLNNYPLQIPDDAPQRQKKLNWTGDKVNIAELAYGLYYTGQINGGSCDVVDIIAWLEDSLNVQMGSVHRKFIDIRSRKTISYTKFLDQMREAIQKRVEEDFVYKPNRGIKLQNGPSDIK